jgi:stage V sporulation protein AE
MEVFLIYLKVFAVGGAICVIGQILINTTKITSARILVIFVVSGAFLHTIGVYKYIEEFGKAGATIPISGFGASLAKGAIKSVQEIGFLGIFHGGTERVAVGLAAAIFVGFIIGLLFRSKTKK